MSQNVTVLEGTTEKAAEAVPEIIVDRGARRRLGLASLGMAIFGVALFLGSYASGLLPTESFLLTVAGVSVILLAFLFYYLSPARFLRNDVSDAMCVSSAEFMYRTVMPFAGENKCVYVPPAQCGDERTLLLVTRAGSVAGNDNNAGIKDQNIYLVPPGCGLMEHAKRLGARFTGEGLEDEVRDVLVNGFDLAGRVSLVQSRDRVNVEIRNVASASLCAGLRNKNPGICTVTACPLCSFVGCAVAEGTGRKAVLDEATVHGKSISLSFGLA